MLLREWHSRGRRFDPAWLHQGRPDLSRRNYTPLRWLAVGMVAPGFFTTAFAATVQPSQPAMYKVGQITWHAQRFVDRDVIVSGYLLKREKGYVIVSDEARGGITVHDLPVSGPGIDQMQPMAKYVMRGRFLDHGIDASNGNRYHLELSAAPEGKP